MEQQNRTDTDQFLTLGPTLNEPHTPKEAGAHANNNNNNNGVNLGVGSASDLVVTVARSEAVGSGQGVKRGRGRPRKYDAVGSAVVPATAPPGFSDHAAKRGRGRPRGSGKLQILASIGGFVAETAGGSFIPHVLTVNSGEDVVGKIMSFFDKGPRAVCVLSATGTVSSVVFRKPPASGHGTLRCEGRFEILSLSGSCTYASSANGAVHKTGKLSISLAKPDGTVFGGVIESSLVAACPIQLVMATFKQNISNQIKRKQLSESSNAPIIMANPNSERDQLKVPRLTEGEKSCPSPTTGLEPTATTTNGVADNVFPATSNGVADYATPPDHNMLPVSVNGVDLDCQTPQPVTDQRITADVNASVIEL
ncbi:AT-hook motif nuclear-localized protein 9 [Spatholobus suberectus]|nr:AT-hook motif nuclear-localized protein 9 [Spatholobus suberectus]